MPCRGAQPAGSPHLRVHPSAAPRFATAGGGSLPPGPPPEFLPPTPNPAGPRGCSPGQAGTGRPRRLRPPRGCGDPAEGGGALGVPGAPPRPGALPGVTSPDVLPPPGPPAALISLAEPAVPGSSPGWPRDRAGGGHPSAGGGHPSAGSGHPHAPPGSPAGGCAPPGPARPAPPRPVG